MSNAQLFDTRSTSFIVIIKHVYMDRYVDYVKIMLLINAN